MNNQQRSRSNTKSDSNSPFTVIGIDILPGSSPESRKKNYYAMTILDEDGGVIQEQPKLILRKILELARKENSRFLAVDNIYEIARDRKGVQTLAEQLPDSCSLVQVTGSPRTGYTRISTLAKSLGLAIRTKLNSQKTAEIVARLCLAGMGFKVATVEDEVKITVSRGRSLPQQGGWSQSRYQRNIEIAVARSTRAFKDFLKSQEYEYDIYDEFGRRSVFFVRFDSDEALSSLKSAMRKCESDLARIRLDAIPKSSVEFIPLSTSSGTLSERLETRNIVVGLDPGITVGLSIIDLSGRVLESITRREFSTSAIVRTIGEFGNPVIVASDVKPIPNLVGKIARTFGAVVFGPLQGEVPVAEKRRRIEEFREHCSSSHERDSLYAALNALDNISYSLKRTEEVIRERYPELLPSQNEIKRQVILGQSIESAIHSLSKTQVIPEDSDAAEPILESRSELRERLNSQHVLLQKRDREIDELRLEISIQRKKLQEVEHARSDLFEKFNKLKRKRANKIERDRKISEKNREIKRLRESAKQQKDSIANLKKHNALLQRVKAMWERGDMILLKTMPRFTDQGIDALDREVGIADDDVILVLDPSGGGSKTADKLVAKQVRAIIVPDKAPELSHLAEREFRNLAIPVLSLPIVQFGYRERGQDLVVETLDYLYVVEKHPLEREIQKQESLLLDKLRKKEHSDENKRKVRLITAKKEKHPFERLLEAYRRDWIESQERYKEDDQIDECDETKDKT